MEKTKVTIEVGGQIFRLSGTESEEYMRGLAASVSGRIEDVQSRYPNLAANKCVLLAMLNLEDELQRLQAEYKALDEKIAQLREMPRTPAPVKHPFERMETKKRVGV